VGGDGDVALAHAARGRTSSSALLQMLPMMWSTGSRSWPRS
jgi:hypothetical protein